MPKYSHKRLLSQTLNLEGDSKSKKNYFSFEEFLTLYINVSANFFSYLYCINVYIHTNFNLVFVVHVLSLDE